MVDTMENSYMQEHDEPRSEIDWRLARTMQLSFSGLIVFVMVVIWIATGFGDYFWPIWVWFGLTVPIAFQYAIRRANAGPRQWRALNTHASLAVVAGGILTFVWALTGFGFWLFWPLFSFGAGVFKEFSVIHAGRASGHARKTAKAKIHFVGERFGRFESAIGDGAH